MTAAHLVFAVATTCYIFLAIQFEEHDLVRSHSEYRNYRDQTSMIIPMPPRKRDQGSAAGELVSNKASGVQ
jgi:protein-S-isoprenylcysteine O-methyltransferase Ste14